MKKFIIRYLIASLCFSSLALPAMATTVCGPTKRVLMYENGINNTIVEALGSMMILKKHEFARRTKAEQQRTTVGYLYNHTHKPGSDVVESAKEKIFADNFITAMANELADAAQNIAPDVTIWLRDLVKDLLASVDNDLYASDHDISKHLAMLWNLLNQGYIVLIVAHSQGNLLANLEVAKIYGDPVHPLKTASLGIVSVGNPASYVSHYMGLPQVYTTADEDRVIFAVRVTALPPVVPPLPANVTNGDRDGDTLLGHNFSAFYMKDGTLTEADIMHNIDVMWGVMWGPTVTVVTFDLTWSGPSGQMDAGLENKGIDPRFAFYSEGTGNKMHGTLTCDQLVNGYNYHPTWHDWYFWYDPTEISVPAGEMIKIYADISVAGTTRHFEQSDGPGPITWLTIDADPDGGLVIDY